MIKKLETRNRPALRAVAAATTIAIVAVTVIAGAAAQESATPRETPLQQRSPEEIQALALLHMESGSPGPEHERLAAMEGTWDIEITMWPQRGAAPMTMNGTVEAEMILGGRFLVQTSDLADTDASGEMMSILGFDRRSGEYTLIELDTSGTYWVAARGPANESGNGAVLSGEDYDAIFEGTQLYDFVLDWPDADTFRTQIIFKDEFHTGGGPPFKMVEKVSRRRR